MRSSAPIPSGRNPDNPSRRRPSSVIRWLRTDSSTDTATLSSGCLPPARCNSATRSSSQRRAKPPRCGSPSALYASRVTASGTRRPPLIVRRDPGHRRTARRRYRERPCGHPQEAAESADSPAAIGPDPGAQSRGQRPQARAPQARGRAPRRPVREAAPTLPMRLLSYLVAPGAPPANRGRRAWPRTAQEQRGPPRSRPPKSVPPADARQ